MAEPQLPTGYEPNDLNEMNNTEVTPVFFHRPSMTSTYDSAGSIATPPLESDFDVEQLRDMLASPLYLQDRKLSADRSRVYHSCIQKLSVMFISRPSKCGETCSCVLTPKEVESRNTLGWRRFSLAHRAVRGENEALSSFSEAENAARLALQEQEMIYSQRQNLKY